MKCRGQSMVEFAMIAPVICLLSFGSFDLGLAMWRKMLMNQAAYTGARVAATQTAPSDADVATAVQNVASFVDAGEITIDRNHTILSAGDAVQITLTNDSSYLTGLLPGSSLLLTTTVSMLKEAGS